MCTLADSVFDSIKTLADEVDQSSMDGNMEPSLSVLKQLYIQNQKERVAGRDIKRACSGPLAPH